MIIKLKLNILPFLLFVFSINTTIAQQKQLEEAKAAVDTLFFSNTDKALEISEGNLNLAVQSGDSLMITYFYDQAGELNRKKGNYNRAIELLEKCLIFKKHWTDLKDLSITYNNLGKTHFNKGNYDLAVYNFYEALKLMETSGNLIGQAFYLNNLAAMYDLQKNYTRALEYYERSLKIKEELKDEKGIAASNTNLGITFYNLGDYDKALLYHQKAYDIYSLLDDKTKTVRTLNNLGENYIRLKDFDKALENLLLANNKRDSIDSETLKYSISNNIAHCYLLLNELDNAMKYNNDALSIVNVSQSFKGLKDVYQVKSMIAKKEQNYMMAIEFLEISNQYNDSLLNESSLNSVAEMSAKYEYEKSLREISDKELTIAKKQKQIEEAKLRAFYWIGISVILIIIVIIFFMMYWLKRKNASLLEGQMALIDSQNKKLETINSNVNEQLSKLQITLEEKEELINNVFTKSKSKELPAELLSLSKREMEVLSHLALGWSDEQLAQKLFVSKSTVKTHLRRIYSKLLVRGRAEAVAIAHRHDLIGNVEEEFETK